MEELNNRPQHLHSSSRRKQFELLNKALLIPLPDNSYEDINNKRAKVDLIVTCCTKSTLTQYNYLSKKPLTIEEVEEWSASIMTTNS
jgi:hypothetical protein